MFATYNVQQNAPSFLNDKNRYFPNLPEDIKSGIEKTQGFTDAYYMFDEATVTVLNFKFRQWRNLGLRLRYELKAGSPVAKHSRLFEMYLMIISMYKLNMLSHVLLINEKCFYLH